MDEPRWHKANTLLDLSSDLKYSNESDVRAAMGIPTRVFSDLPVFRHFFAHRSERTAGPALMLAPTNGVSAALRPTEVLLSRGLGRHQPLLADWLDDMWTVIDDLCR